MGLKLIGQWGASAPPLPRIPYPMLCCGRLDTTEYPGFSRHKRTTNMAAMMRGCRVLERAPFLVSLSLFLQLG